MPLRERSHRYVHVAIPRPIDRLFTYVVPEEWSERMAEGSRVRVPFGRARMVGFVDGWAPAPRGIEVKPVEALLDEVEPLLDATLCALTRWVAVRYGCRWAEAAEAAVPRPMRLQPFRAERVAWDGAAGAGLGDALEPPSWLTDQAWHDRLVSLAPVDAGGSVLLLQAGAEQRLALYRYAAARMIAAGKTVLWLVPEVAISERVELLLGEALGRWAVVLHGGLAAGARRERWGKASTGAARLVLGTRSAVFTRMPDLGLIIVDDEQDASYRPEQMPHYHTRDVALQRGRVAGASVLLGSLAPSLEAWALVRQRTSGEFVRLGASSVLRATMPRPRVTVVDMREELKERRRTAGFSRALQYRLEQTLRSGGRALLFLNRRGFATAVRCTECGYQVRCERCGVAMVYHFDAQRLTCHYCDTSASMSELCPVCHKGYLRYKGLGTERVESDLHRLFPTARIARVDSDVVQKPQAIEEIERALEERRLDLVIGTQLIHRSMGRLPPMDLVGVMAVDTMLSQPDFRAAERVLQLLEWLASCAVGSSGVGELVVQTFTPEHPVIRAVATGSADAFWEEEWRLREAVQLPPACHLIEVDCIAASADVSADAAKRLATALRRAVKRPLDSGLDVGQAPRVQGGPERAQRVESVNGAQDSTPSTSRRIEGGSGAVSGPFATVVGRGRQSGHRLLVRVPGEVEEVVARVRQAMGRLKKSRGLRIHLDVDPA